MTKKGVLHLDAKTEETAAANAKEILTQTKKAMGFVPNMYGNMANSPSAFEIYSKGYSLFREKSGFTPPEQEVVFLTISRENDCAYCMAAHSLVGDKMTKVPAPVLAAVRDGADIEDVKLSALSQFTRHLLLSKGRPLNAEVAAFLKVGYKEEQILEIVLAIAVKTISNYTNHLFDTPVDPAFSAYLWK